MIFASGGYIYICTYTYLRTWYNMLVWAPGGFGTGQRRPGLINRATIYSKGELSADSVEMLGFVKTVQDSAVHSWADDRFSFRRITRVGDPNALRLLYQKQGAGSSRFVFAKRLPPKNPREKVGGFLFGGSSGPSRSHSGR